MSQEIARLHATVGADTNELHSKLNEASRGIDTFRRETESAGSGIQSFFDRVASTAGGVIAANLFNQLTNQVTNFVKSAIAATAELQYTEIGITGLLAREISKGELVTETYQVMTQAAGGQAGANKKLMASQESLTGKVADYTYHLALAQQKEVELGGKKKVSVSQTMAVQHAVETYTQKLQGAQKELGGVTEKLTDHAAATYAVSTATREMYINQTTISEAYPIAQARAKELMNELARLAIVSPYQVEMVNSTFKLAMTFGYSSKEAMTFTKAILNVAAGTGATNEMLHRMAYNFAQIRLVGKVTAMDMRQLAMAGFDLNGVLQFTGEKFGIVINDYADFNKAIASGKITWQQFTEAFAEYADVNFGGASERMATTLTGLQSTFNDIFMLTMPQVIRPALEVVNQRLTDMLNIFLDVRDSGVLEDVGAQLGKTVTRWMAPIDTVLKSVTRFRDIQSQLKIPNLLPDLQHQLGGEMAALSGGGGMVGVLAKAIFGDETGGKIVTGIKWVKTHLQDIKAVVIGFGTVFAGLKIAGIVGSLITTFGALASPIALLITLSGLLVAAYIRDWGGIRTAVNGFWEKTGKPVFTQIVDWAKIKIPEAMKGIREKWDELVTWASDFWGRIKSAYQAEGAQGVIDVVWVEAQKIGGEIIRGIRSKIDEMWPIVSAKFSEWGTQIPAMIQSWWKGTEIPGEFGMIVTPGMEEKMGEMGNQLGEWILGGLTTALTAISPDLGKGFSDIVDWLQTNIPNAVAETSKWFKETLIPAFDDTVRKINTELIPALTDLGVKGFATLSLEMVDAGKATNNLKGAIDDLKAAFGASDKEGARSGVVGFIEAIGPEFAASIAAAYDPIILYTKYVNLLAQAIREVIALKAEWDSFFSGKKYPEGWKPPGMTPEPQPGHPPPAGGIAGAAHGADFIARIPQLIRVGEGRYPERVTVTPLMGAGGGGQPIIINFNAPVSRPEEARRQAKIGVMEGLRARGLA